MSSEHSFVDRVLVSVAGGDGGHGCISFRREKHVPFGGPNGGDGGKGGDVWFEADPTLLTLADLNYRSHVVAERGAHGEGKNMTGRSGEDRVVRVPLGAVVSDESGRKLADLTEPGQRFLAAAGGGGGAGNQHYPTSVNQAPRKAKDGEPGQRRRLIAELKLIADVGFVGLPNAGKSTLLQATTRATPRIAPYPFTTLHPNLGVMELDEYRRATLADIPGLIEGASRGVGLGDRFLRHIERTALLVHLVAPDPEFLQTPDPDADAAEIGARLSLDAYRLVREELKTYSDAIARKPEIPVLAKIDLLSPGSREVFLRVFREEGVEALPLSAATGEGLDDLRARIDADLVALGRIPPADAPFAEAREPEEAEPPSGESDAPLPEGEPASEEATRA